MRHKVAVVAALIVLVLVNWSIAGKERQLKEGKVVFLALAPVDPRSLMQGDYMALNFQLANEVYRALPKDTGKLWRRDLAADDGYVVVSLDEKGIANYKRLDDGSPLQRNEVVLRYRVRNGVLKFATNAFFFQEGHGKYYQAARFGKFRVADNGEMLLTHMLDKDLKQLGPESSQP